MLLPIWEMEKTEVRGLAKELGLPWCLISRTSQEICFWCRTTDYAGPVAKKTPELRAFRVADASGAVVGRHEGHQHFTIGQRKGRGVAFGYPTRVTGIDAATNRVTLGC